MADPVPASETVVDNDDAEYLYSETSAGNFRKVETTKFVTALGLSASDEGKTIYVDDTGAFEFRLPSGLSFLSEQDASGAASVAFTTGFSTDYDEYVFQFIGIQASATDNSLLMTLSLNAGSSYIATGYEWDNTAVVSDLAGTPESTYGSSATAITMLAAVSSGGTLHGKAQLLVSTTISTLLHHLACQGFPGGTLRSETGAARLTTASRVNAVRFAFASGTISGQIRMYGVNNS